MMQFGLVSYQNQPDYARCLEFIDAYKRAKSLNNFTRPLLLAALAENGGIGKAVLIYVRLHFWGQAGAADTLKDLADKITPETFDKADVFEKQEIYDCLGQDLLGQCIGRDSDFLALSSRRLPDDYDVDLSQINPEPSETWCYIPPPTGFFSVIENIVLAKFFCKLNNKAFKLDVLHDWWRYPVPFLDVMSAYDVTEFNLATSSEKYMMWDTLREYFRYINPGNFNFLKKFKAQEYRKIKLALWHYANRRQNDSYPAQDDCILFARGGDKVILETIEAPFEYMKSDVQAMRERGVPIHVLSDDHALADSLIQRLHTDGINNITDTSRAGYHLKASTTADDVHTIIKNYLMLSETRYSISCPSSNLVNSAHWSNTRLDFDIPFKSISSLRYLYL